MGGAMWGLLITHHSSQDCFHDGFTVHGQPQTASDLCWGDLKPACVQCMSSFPGSPWVGWKSFQRCCVHRNLTPTAGFSWSPHTVQAVRKR